MKRFILVVLLLFLLVFVILQAAKAKVGRDLAQPVQERILTPTPFVPIDKNQQVTNSVFVPYWAVTEQESGMEYDQYIYFGITPTTKGIQNEAGLQRVESFKELVPSGKKSLLALRMVDSEMNADILSDKAAQKKIIAETMTFAKKHNFSGVVLDLEMSAIPFDSLVTQISEFSRDIALQAGKQELTFEMTLYGDTFYRVRPFDVKTLSQTNENFMLMAYDFHKSRSNPGPNFPLKGSKTYGYDMEKLADDILRYSSPAKVSIIFGMFGYDWPVDDKGKAIDQGKPLTYEQIQATFLNDCKYKNCTIKRDALSAETSIAYIDANDQKHIVWFEDMQSVKEKQEYLRTRGITNFSFWAYSYF